MTSPTPQAGRFRPHAAREMASMFDDVSHRYDLLNRWMTLGQDASWRSALASAVPDRAVVVLDLCTGGGASLAGLVRPGRTVLGADVSLRMLEAAGDLMRRPGWAPRLVCADAFHLPLGDHAVDAITIAFGIRNLRPRPTALAEIVRVLAPGGTLAVLEACAPRPGAFAPIHRFHLRRVVPLLGRLSPDPTAYAYLRDSIFEFGDGRAFESDLAAAGFTPVEERSFLFGASRLWVARAPGPGSSALQNARSTPSERGELPHAGSIRGAEWSGWMLTQLVTSAVLFVALAVALIRFLEVGKELPLGGWQRWALGLLLAGGVVFFGARAVLLGLSRGAPPPRR
jgi:demethylmenaquinone methyltransferase/2-methoxy-6-polyprenyl-1,4-benzoquinol methylase